MGFFDDDGFDNIVREMFQGRVGNYPDNHFIEGEKEERNMDFIETDENIFLTFELPGYSEKDVSVDVEKNRIKIIAKKKVDESIQSYLSKKLSNGVEIIKTLPKIINPKMPKITFNNGILEVRFLKK